jgi:hypothetical protein
MNLNEASPRDELKSDAAFVTNDAPHENIRTSQLLVLCIGIASLITVDVLIFVYFLAI